MPMNEYKIVNATQLDADLASIADMIKTKTLETDIDYVFPEDFIIAIDKMSYNANPNTEDDLIVEGDTITVNAGYYQEAISKFVESGLVFINSLNLEENPIVALSEDGKSIEAEYTVEKIPEVSVTPGYISNITNVGTFKSSGKTTIAIQDLITAKAESDIIDNGDGTITIPAGYYAEDILYTIPTI